MKSNFHLANRGSLLASLATIATICGALSAAAAEDEGRFLPQQVISSTIPANGDLNPYGVAVVPPGFPAGAAIAPGDVLVSNFNNSGNLQGTGTTIIKFTPTGPLAPGVPTGQPGNATTFFQGSPFAGLPGLGLTLALGVLKRGFVLVGAVPTTDGAHVQPPGALFFLDRNGNEISPTPYTNHINGPWGLTIDDRFDHARVFVANVLDGTVTRLNLAVNPSTVLVTSATTVASGYAFRTDPAAVVLGPTGLVYDAATDTLFVASTADNAVFAVAHAGTASSSAGKGRVVYKNDHLRGPLALAVAPNGNFVTANGDAVHADTTQPSEVVEFTRAGEFVGQFNLDAAPDGAFGLAIADAGEGNSRLVVVDDNANNLTATDLRSLTPRPNFFSTAGGSMH